MHKNIILYLLGASFLGVRGISCGSTSNSKSWTLVCMFFDFGLPGPGPGPWLPFPSSFCFLGLEWRDEAERAVSFPNFRNLLSPFLSCQSVSICFREQKYKSYNISVSEMQREPRDRNNAFHLSLFFQCSEAPAGRGEERFQLKLKCVQLFNANTIILGAAEHCSVAWTHFQVVHRFEVIVLQRGTVLKFTHLLSNVKLYLKKVKIENNQAKRFDKCFPEIIFFFITINVIIKCIHTYNINYSNSRW